MTNEDAVGSPEMPIILDVPCPLPYSLALLAHLGKVFLSFHANHQVRHQARPPERSP
jgi:hypothetical protein